MGNVMHLWECEGIKASRILADPELAGIDVSKIPDHILLGVPPFRPVEPAATLCPILDQGAGANWDIEAIFGSGIDVNDELAEAFRCTGILGYVSLSRRSDLGNQAGRRTRSLLMKLNSAGSLNTTMATILLASALLGRYLESSVAPLVPSLPASSLPWQSQALCTLLSTT